MTDLPVPTLIKHHTCSLQAQMMITMKRGQCLPPQTPEAIPYEWFRSCPILGEGEAFPGIYPNESAMIPIVLHSK